MPDDKDLIPNEEVTSMTESGPNTPVEIASSKALHDQKVKKDSLLVNEREEESNEEDFVKFNIDAIDDTDRPKKRS
ncbi:MAG: hypothetical protein JJU16_10970 [Alkalibacterium sp.]|nr:hypothetical protein [Alkalibacterium sp.]